MKLWIIVEEIFITCEETKEVEIGFEGMESLRLSFPEFLWRRVKDEAADVWKLRIAGAERRSGNVGGNLSVPLS